jgi:Tfp pilus assembly protein PilF
MMEKIPSTEALFLRIYVALEHGNYRIAKDLLQQALAENPENSEAESLLAYALLTEGFLEPAEFHIKNALHNDPHNPHFHYLYSIICRQAHKEIQAEEEILTAIRTAPDEADYHAEYSMLLFKNGQLDKAIQIAKNALSLDPYNETAMLVLGLKGIENYEINEAQSVFRQQLKNNPSSVHAHAGMAHTYLYQNNPKEAGNEAKLALQLDPNDEQAQEIYLSSLKARNPIYWLFWRWTLLCTRMGGTYSIMLIIGIWAFVNGIGTFRRSYPTLFEQNPALDTGLTVFFTSYIIFCIYTWIANPLFSFFARKGYLK